MDKKTGEITMKIGKLELTSLLINLICMKLFLAYPKYILSYAGNAAWIISALATLAALFIFFLCDKLYRTNMTVIDISRKIGGKPLAVITGLIVFIMFLANVFFTFRIFPETVRMILLHNTPIAITVLILAIGVLVGAYCGIEALARITSFFLPVCAFVLIAFLLLLTPHYMIKNITPILGTGIGNIASGSFRGVSFFADIIALNILLPQAKNRDTAASAGYRAILISGISLTLLLLAIGFVYPYPVSSRFMTPLYQLTRLVSIGNFFSRIEAFFEFIWSIGMFLYASVYVTLMCIVWKETFGLKHYKPLILPILAICLVSSFVSQSFVDFIDDYKIFMEYFSISIVCVPIIFGILERIKNS